jgi:hypothetical protein
MPMKSAKIGSSVLGMSVVRHGWDARGERGYLEMRYRNRGAVVAILFPFRVAGRVFVAGEVMDI